VGRGNNNSGNVSPFCPPKIPFASQAWVGEIGLAGVRARAAAVCNRLRRARARPKASEPSSLLIRVT